MTNEQLENSKFHQQKEHETRAQFALRIASTMLRSTDEEIWAGGEFLTADKVADMLEELSEHFPKNNQ